MEKEKQQASIRRRIRAEVETRNRNVSQRRQLEHSMSDDQAEDLLTQIVCECSNKNCNQRIALTVNERKLMRQNPRHFIILPGHVDPEIEHVVKNFKKCLVVAKMFVDV